MQKQENPVVLSLVLLVISVAVALLLAFTNAITKDKIEENNRQEANAAKQIVLPEATEFVAVEKENYNDETGLVQEVFEGRDAVGNVVGWCVSATPSGYGGEIKIMVGIKTDNTVSGVKVISHAETAGLGAKAAEDEFPAGFKGKMADGKLGVNSKGNPKENEIVAISGATITSKAVTAGVNAAADVVKQLNGGV